MHKIFGRGSYKVVNAKKVIFVVVLVDISRKYRKNTHFWEKNTSTNGQKFGDTSTKVPRPTPKYP